MKKIFTTALLAMLGLNAFAQLAEGTKVVSGSIYTSGYLQENKLPSSAKYQGFSLTINPAYGIFVKENLEFGLATSIGFSRIRYTSNTDTLSTVQHYRSTVVGLSPYINKYWALSDRFYLTAGASVSAFINPSKSEADITAEVNKYLRQAFMVSINSGLTFLATEKIGLFMNLASINYSKSKNRPRAGTDGSTETSDSFYLSASPQNFYFGINYFLNK